MNLNSEFGKQSSFIYYEYWTAEKGVDSLILTISEYMTYKFDAIDRELKTLNSYHQVPTFGCDTIRHFQTNVSGLKKMAARDFKDILQVSFSSNTE
jgi:hypothetical protein